MLRDGKEIDPKKKTQNQHQMSFSVSRVASSFDDFSLTC